MRRGVTSVLLASALLAGCGEEKTPTRQPVVLPTEQPLLGAPDPTGPTARGVYLKDPEGQVEAIAAGQHLVAWTVRTPADKREGKRRPQQLPKATKLVIVDERGGEPAKVDLGARWVRNLRVIRSATGPQLAVESCIERARSSCNAELLTLTPSVPAQVTARSGGADAKAAVNGHLESGRRLSTKGRGCATRLTVDKRQLPRLPQHDTTYPRCVGVTDTLIYGRYAFAAVARSASGRQKDVELYYAIDVTKRSSARWREVYLTYRGTDGGSSIAIGPAMTDVALYWDDTDSELEAVYSLGRASLPSGKTMTAEPIVPDAQNICAIAATDEAIYELMNPRCSVWPSSGSGTSGEIRRIVNPEFRSAEE